MIEEWRPVVGFEGLYEVSDLGNVRSLDRMKWSGRVFYPYPGRLMKRSIEKAGYLTVKLYTGKRERTYMVHLLVIQAFVGFCPVDLECRHLDGNKQNPKLSNLEYGTRRENRLDVYRHGILTPERNIEIGRKTRDTKDEKYGRKHWVAATFAGVEYSKQVYDL